MSWLVRVCSIIAGALHRSVESSYTGIFHKSFIVPCIFSVAVNPCHDAYIGRARVEWLCPVVLGTSTGCHAAKSMVMHYTCCGLLLASDP